MGKVERRQQILAHARDVFAKKGYHAAKIDDIVAAAGIARGTFYLYFEDKRGIFEEIVDRTITRIGMSISRVDLGHDIATQVKYNIRIVVRMLIEDRATTKILLSAAFGVDAAFDRKLLSFYDEITNLLVQSLTEGQRMGLVEKGDVRLFAYLGIGALKELLFQIVQRGADYDEDALVENVYRFLKNGFLREPT